MANKYWVGGSGTWDGYSTTTWSDTSGGPSGATLPGTTDTVIVDANSGSPSITLSGSLACQDLVTTGSTCSIISNGSLTVNGNLTLSTNTTWSNTGTLNLPGTGTITTNGVIINSPISVSGAPITLGSSLTTTKPFSLTQGTFALNGQTLTCLAFSRPGALRTTITGTSAIINVTGSNNTNWYIPSATGLTLPTGLVVNAIYSGSTGTRVFTQVSMTNVPTLNVNSGSDTLTFGASSGFTSLNLSGFSGTLTGTNALTITGSVTAGTGMTWTSTSPLTINGTGNLTSNGVVINSPITIDGTGITVTLSGALVTTGTLTLTGGTFNLGTYTLTCPIFSSSGGSTRALNLTNATINLTSSGTVWNIGKGSLTLTSTGSTIQLSDATTTAKIFAGGGLTYGNLVLGGSTGSAVYTISGSNTFTTVSSSKTVAFTLTLTGGTTTHVSNWSVRGLAANLATLNSSSGTATLTKDGGGLALMYYGNISSIAATPANAWYAYSSIDGGSNSGWVFSSGRKQNFLLLM